MNLQTAALIVGFVELVWCVIQLFGLIRNWTIFGSSYIIWFLIGAYDTITQCIRVSWNSIQLSRSSHYFAPLCTYMKKIGHELALYTLIFIHCAYMEIYRALVSFSR